MNINEYLRQYPWQSGEMFDTEPADFLWQFHLNASITDLWPFLTDTSTLNKFLGLPQMYYQERGGRLFGKSTNAGVVSEWEEVPWEWEFHKGLNNARIYSKGFAHYLRSRYILERVSDQETNFFVHFGWIPRNIVMRLLLKVAMPDLRRKYSKALRKIVVLIQNRKDIERRQTEFYSMAGEVALNGNALEKLESLCRLAVREGAQAEKMDLIKDYILTGPDEELNRIRLKVLARRFGLPLNELTAVFLYASRAGIFNLSWDVTCPHCRGVRESLNTLGDIPLEGRCDACEITFSTEDIRALEVIFHLNPDIRDVPKKMYCAAEPATKRHILIQKSILPGNIADLTVDLERGRYRIRIKGRTEYSFLDAGEGPDTAIRYEGGETEFRTVQKPQITAVNNSSEPAVFILERKEEDNDSLRPAELFSFQLFRDIYGNQSLAQGMKIELGLQNILFTDIVGSTKMYSRIGDGEAFASVRKHFLKIYEIVRSYNGAVVKTIGDSAMVAFSDALYCMQAAIDLQKAFAGGQDTGGVFLRISIHSGPCIAVNLNSGVDYFGGTVNLAAKLQSLAEAKQIVFTDDLTRDPRVQSCLKSVGYPVERVEFSPSWMDKPVTVRRITV